MISVKNLVAAIAVLGIPVSAGASSIIGVINFSSGSGGGVVLQDVNGNETTDLAVAKAVKSWISPKVDNGSDSFAIPNVPAGQSVILKQPWIFGQPTLPNPLWSIVTGNFSFALTSSTIDSQDSGTLLISGTGILSGDNFDNTPANWYFSTQGSATNGMFSWSSTTEAVPETGTLSILGAAFLGACFLRRRNPS